LRELTKILSLHWWPPKEVQRADFGLIPQKR